MTITKYQSAICQNKAGQLESCNTDIRTKYPTAVSWNHISDGTHIIYFSDDYSNGSLKQSAIDTIKPSLNPTHITTLKF